MNASKWLKRYFILLAAALAVTVGLVVWIDPFFHYHGPADGFYYELDNQRSQNDGILRHFDYDAIITGNSVTENFRTSEAEELFGLDFVKTCFSGATFREINDRLTTALDRHPDTKLVIRCLDFYGFFQDKDALRLELGSYPDYLYDRDPFNDVRYVLNKDILLGRCLPMLARRLAGAEPGMTSFDDYSYWSEEFTYGKDTVLKHRMDPLTPYAQKYPVSHLSQEEADRIRANARQNLVQIALDHPDTRFYYFFPPFGGAYWGSLWEGGGLEKTFEAERLFIEACLPVENITLFSFCDWYDVITDLNNYKDDSHYGAWVNSMMLEAMAAGEGILTQENYRDYLEEKLAFFNHFDYTSMLRQEDYPDGPNGPIK